MGALALAMALFVLVSVSPASAGQDPPPTGEPPGAATAAGGDPGSETTPPADEPASEEAEQEPAPDFLGRIHGYAFGDYYWAAANHLEEIPGTTGFWFRRIYLGYDQPFGDSGFDMRLRLEMNSPGKLQLPVGLKLEPFVKDAYLRWRRNGQAVYVGLSPTPTWDVVEGIWGYRSVEKTPLDLQKFGSSRDFGVAARGSLGSSGRVDYHMMFGNGASTKGETNSEKKIAGSVGFHLTEDLLFEVYADWDPRVLFKDRKTWQVFLAYQRPEHRLGLQFAQQIREDGEGNDDKLEIASIFYVRKLTDKLNLLTRVDRMFDPNPAGGAIDYLPFDPTAKSTLVIAGIDYTPTSTVHLIPNFEWVHYSENDEGVRPDDDLMVRATFYWTFSSR